MKRRDFLKSLIVTIAAPSILGAMKPEIRSVAYSEYVIDCQGVPLPEMKLVVECNKPVRVMIEQSDYSDFAEAENADPSNITKRFIRAKYEYVGNRMKVSSYITKVSGIHKSILVMDYAVMDYA